MAISPKPVFGATIPKEARWVLGVPTSTLSAPSPRAYSALIRLTEPSTNTMASGSHVIFPFPPAKLLSIFIESPDESGSG
jgi:hypothetical protein